MHRAGQAGIAGLFLLLGYAAGCSHPELEKLDTVPVRGKITFNGGALPKGGTCTISCIWMGGDLGVSNWGVHGTVDEDGYYELSTGLGIDHGYTALLAEKRGVPEGRYQVEVRMLETFDAERHNWKNEQRSLLPKRYADSSKSGLELRVRKDAPAGAYDLRLSSH